MRPPRIMHVGRRCKKAETEALISECAQRIHLTVRGRKLLLFYSSCGNGFCPAKKLIFNEIGIEQKHLHEYRGELEKLGLITIDKETNTLYVNWERIRLYSTLDASLTNRFRRNTTVSKSMYFCRMKKITIGMRYKPRIEGRPLTPAQKHFYDALDDMTEREWNSILRAMGVVIPAPLNIPVPNPGWFSMMKTEMVNPEPAQKIPEPVEEYTSHVEDDLPF